MLSFHFWVVNCLLWLKMFFLMEAWRWSQVAFEEIWNIILPIKCFYGFILIQIVRIVKQVLKPKCTPPSFKNWAKQERIVSVSPTFLDLQPNLVVNNSITQNMGEELLDHIPQRSTRVEVHSLVADYLLITLCTHTCASLDGVSQLDTGNLR